MFIVDDDRKYVVNVDNVTRIRLNGNEVQAYIKGETMPYPIGRYKTVNRASEVFEEMLNDIWGKNVAAGRTYFMPKE